MAVTFWEEGAAWVARSAERPTPRFSSGHEFMVGRLSPASGSTLVESACGFSPPLPCTHSLSLSLFSLK